MLYDLISSWEFDHSLSNLIGFTKSSNYISHDISHGVYVTGMQITVVQQKAWEVEYWVASPFSNNKRIYQWIYLMDPFDAVVYRKRYSWDRYPLELARELVPFYKSLNLNLSAIMMKRRKGAWLGFQPWVYWNEEMEV